MHTFDFKMSTKKYTACVIGTAMLLGLINQTQAYDYDETIYDAEFWEGFDDEEPPYAHPWKDIPVFVNRTEISWYFNMTHEFLLGVERGLYMNDSL